MSDFTNFRSLRSGLHLRDISDRRAWVGLVSAERCVRLFEATLGAELSAYREHPMLALLEPVCHKSVREESVNAKHTSMSATYASSSFVEKYPTRLKSVDAFPSKIMPCARYTKVFPLSGR